MICFALFSLDAYAQTFTEKDFDTVYKDVVSGEITLVDARPKSDWNEGHFSKAVSLPSDRLSKMSDEELFKLIPKNKKVFTHCHLGVGARSMQVASFLKSKGYDVSPFKVGYSSLKSTDERSSAFFNKVFLTTTSFTFSL